MNKRIVAVQGRDGKLVVDPDIQNQKITHAYGWADLDAANKRDRHYSPRTNAYLLELREKKEFLEHQEIELIDRMEDEARERNILFSLHPSFPMLVYLQNLRAEAEEDYSQLWVELNKRKSEGTAIHIPNIAEKVPEWEKSLEKA